MKRIKIEYWILTVVFGLITFLITFLSNENWASIMLAGVAIMISTIAMGLSDPKKLDFIGEIKVWSQVNRTNSHDNTRYYKVVMHIINNSNDVIDDFVYRLRVPAVLSRIGTKNLHRTDIRHGESLVLIDKSFSFLGTDTESFIPVDFEMVIEDWKKQNIEIIISGININPTTFRIQQTQKKDLLEATRDNPISATRLNKRILKRKFKKSLDQ
jgi:hypothetical protein